MNGTALVQPDGDQGEDAKLIDLPQVCTVFLMFVMILVLILTVLGNITVLVVLRYSNVLNSIVNGHLLISLSIADLLVAVLVMPCALNTVNTGTWRCGEIWGKVNGFGNFLFCISSIMHLMMLSIDRYMAIDRPLFYSMEMTKSRALLLCIIAWVYSAVWAFLPLVGVSSYECFISYIGTCKAKDWSKYGLNFVFAVSVVSGAYGLALIAMGAYVYWKIARVIRSQSQRIENSQCPSLSGKINQINSMSRSTVTLQNLTRKLNRYKRVITLLIVIAVYLVCWSPFCFLLFYEIGSGEKVKGPAGSVAMMAGFIDSCCNPIIYSIKYRNLRTAIMRMIGIKRVMNVDNLYSHENKKERIKLERNAYDRSNGNITEVSVSDLYDATEHRLKVD